MVTLVQEYITESAKKFPQSTAMVFCDTRMSYEELNRRSNRLARFLKIKGVDRGDRVAFCLRKSMNSVVSIVAILKADAMYVPINAQAPAARMRQMIEDASPRIILCESRTLDLVGGGEMAVNLDDAEAMIASSRSNGRSNGSPG